MAQDDVSSQFDPARNRAKQQIGAVTSQRIESLKRRQAQLGGGPGGAFVNQEQQAIQQGGEALAQANEGINAQQAAEQRRMNEIKQGQEFARSERLGSQEYTGQQAAIQRAYGTGEREAGQIHQEGLQKADIEAKAKLQLDSIAAAERAGKITHDDAVEARNQAHADADRAYNANEVHFTEGLKQQKLENEQTIKSNLINTIANLQQIGFPQEQITKMLADINITIRPDGSVDYGKLTYDPEGTARANAAAEAQASADAAAAAAPPITNRGQTYHPRKR